MIRIYPSLISANLLRLQDEIKLLEPYCDGFHLDIMDNHFVPNLTFGAGIIHAISAITDKQLWVHLMVDDPIQWCDTLQIPAESIFSFHFESTKDIPGIIKRIKEKQWQPSIAIKPETDITLLFPFLNDISQVLLMSVEPGFSGQRFLPSVIEKLEPLLKQRDKHQLSFTIGIDGGIDAENISMLAQRGVHDFAIASAIFDQPDPVAALQTLKKALT